MSHITEVKTQLKNLLTLKQTLKDLNIKYVEAEADSKIQIKGWNKETMDVVMKIETGSSYDVGVVLNENKEIEFVADWWGVEMYTEMTQEKFLSKITQKYSYNTIMDKIKDKGYNVVTEEVDEKEQIRIVLRKWE